MAKPALVAWGLYEHLSDQGETSGPMVALDASGATPANPAVVVVELQLMGHRREEVLVVEILGPDDANVGGREVSPAVFAFESDVNKWQSIHELRFVPRTNGAHHVRISLRRDPFHRIPFEVRGV